VPAWTPIGTGGHHGEEVAGRQLRQLAFERQEIA
jgi:hypothetical protein